MREIRTSGLMSGDGRRSFATAPILDSTGRSARCRISEALALTARQIDLSGHVVVFESLKKRRRGVFRVVPVPPELLDTRLASRASSRHGLNHENE